MPTYSATTRKLVTRRTFDALFAYPTADDTGQTSPNNNVIELSRTSRTTSFTVYSGTQPTAQTIEANWVNYNQSAADCLAHYSNGVSWLYNPQTLTYYFTNTADTVTTNALKSGTASWAIIWDASAVNISTEELPGNGRFIVVPVTNNTGVGIIRYTSLTTTSGQAFLPYDGGLSLVEA
jgi:hypothetical protein